MGGISSIWLRCSRGSTGQSESDYRRRVAGRRRQSSTVQANDAAGTFNNQMVDGLDNNERQQGFIGIRPSIDSIAEMQVLNE